MITRKYRQWFVVLYVACILGGGCKSSFHVSHLAATITPERKLRIDFQSDRDLVELRKSRMVQFRCSILPADGTTNRLDTFGQTFIGERTLDDIDRRSYKRSDTPVRYYALLKTDSFCTGNTTTNTDIINVGFVDLRYYIIGVTMAPVVFPRSNEIVLQIDDVEMQNSQQDAAPLPPAPRPGPSEGAR